MYTQVLLPKFLFINKYLKLWSSLSFKFAYLQNLSIKKELHDFCHIWTSSNSIAVFRIYISNNSLLDCEVQTLETRQIVNYCYNITRAQNLVKNPPCAFERPGSILSGETVSSSTLSCLKKQEDCAKSMLSIYIHI